MIDAGNFLLETMKLEVVYCKAYSLFISCHSWFKSEIFNTSHLHVTLFREISRENYEWKQMRKHESSDDSMTNYENSFNFLGLISTAKTLFWQRARETFETAKLETISATKIPTKLLESWRNSAWNELLQKIAGLMTFCNRFRCEAHGW